jgi:hypothetical protein
MTTEYLQSDEQTINLARVTLSYIIEEDRVQLAGEDAQGNTVKLWLTARLLTRLVPHLVQKQVTLGSGQSVAAEPDVSDNTGGDDPSVRCDLGCPEALVTEIDLRFTRDGLMLVFKEDARRARASFMVPATSLPRWNQGIQTCFKQAGWPQETFVPENDSSVAEPTGAVTIH